MVQFKVANLNGREELSRVARIWVNGPPVPAIEKPLASSTFIEDELVRLSANGTTDPDWDALNYTWLAGELEDVVAYGRDVNVTLPVGTLYELILVVRDDTGAEERASVLVTVHPTPVPGEEETGPGHLLLLLHPTGDAPGDQPRDLNECDVTGILRFHQNPVAFVLFRGLFQIGREEFARAMGDLSNGPAIWGPIDVHVEHGHENTGSYGRFAQGISVVIDFIDRYDGPIRRGQYGVGRGIADPLGVPEKINTEKCQ